MFGYSAYYTVLIVKSDAINNSLIVHYLENANNTRICFFDEIVPF